SREVAMESEREMDARPDACGEIHCSGIADFQERLIAIAVISLNQNPAAFFRRLTGVRYEDWLAQGAPLTRFESLGCVAVQVMAYERIKDKSVVTRSDFDHVQVTRVLTCQPGIEPWELLKHRDLRATLDFGRHRIEHEAREFDRRGFKHLILRPRVEC